MERVGDAALKGWRRKVADAVAPRMPFDDDKVRSALGVVFLALAVRYVVGTIGRARRGEPG
jgi:hypothetical protein